MSRSAFYIAIMTLLAACAGRDTQSPGTASDPSSGAAASLPESWIGQWNGPEGTFMRLDAAGATYRVTIRNLDGARTFPAITKAGTIQFERDGILEEIRHTDGEETGMKWLADKTNCLTIRKGEGYCRE